MLHNKKILLALSGSIAVYKAAFLVRLLIKKGATVRVVMTTAATKFVSPLTFSTLSKNPVYSEVSSEEGWNNHVELGLWADLMLVAPATANTLAKMANGLCDNMLLATYLSSRCPVFFAPAMDLDMWEHPSTQNNVAQLIAYGNQLIPVEEGELASGLVGKGRMAEPEHIVSYLEQYFQKGTQQALKGQKVLITSGPTVEAIDPVRFISNRSTGKMGTAIADELASQGAEVILLTGPVTVVATHPNVTTVKVHSAAEMYEAAMEHFPSTTVTILAAAVADYTPTKVADHKIKKKEGEMFIELKRTKDIAAELGKIKKKDQLMVGFAMETDDVFNNAQRKLEKKNLDFIVLNSLRDKGAGFGHDTNKVTFIERNGNVTRFELKTKKEVAEDIAHKICSIASGIS